MREMGTRQRRGAREKKGRGGDGREEVGGRVGLDKRRE